MVDVLTKEYFDKSVQKLATRDDLVVVQQDVATVKQEIVTVKHDVAVVKQDVVAVKQEVAVLRKDVLEEVGGLKVEVGELQASFSDLQTSVDRYLKRTETWHDELMVLQARFTHVVNLLDQKGVIKEEETHLA